jgi:predicted metal-dependent phosphoesterase TrpH
MPSRQPFTALCGAAARPHAAARIDLHVHTTHSDGTYTPAQVIELARRCGLAALAITDHDTLDGIPPAMAANAATDLEIVPAVEISAEYQERELHLLAYFVDTGHRGLAAALQQLRHHRQERFWDMVERLRACGVSLDEHEVRCQAEVGSPGRRHLAMLLVQARRVGSVREAFLRYLGDQGSVTVPKRCLPVQEAIGLVLQAGGVTSWAHPGSRCTRARLTELLGWGLGAVEVEYPACRASRTKELRSLAGEQGLAVTGGSDCHGPGDVGRDVGARGVTGEELEVLRGKAAGCISGASGDRQGAVAVAFPKFPGSQVQESVPRP